LPVGTALPPADEVQALAISQRPELAAQQARIRAERYSVALACKEFYPDFEVISRYDAFWQEEPLRPMVGMNMNLPIYKQKRWAAASEARARVASEQAALESLINELMFEVEQAYRQVEESRRTVQVYEADLLPVARHSIDAARASYLAGRLDFLRLVESQRQLLMLQDSYYEASAAYYMRLAELDRMVGSSAIASTASAVE
jgi:outer membrane protein TolC